MRIIFTLIYSIVAVNSFAQATMNNSGGWATATNWSGSNIGDVVTETVAISNNINPTVNNGNNFTVGATTLNNNNTLTINSGGTLNIGDATHAVNLTTNNNTNISVAGTLVIWGSLVVNNNIVWSITGTVIIKGSVTLSNNANLNVTGGTLQVGGNFNASNNTNVTVPSGSISVAGSVNVGSGSNLSGCAGCFHLGGTCSGPAAFCGNSALPITLASFEAKELGATVELDWLTLSEINFDRFDVESSTTGRDFTIIGSVQGHGNTSRPINYSFLHQTPTVGLNYYRLKSVDFDGSFEYSKVVAANVTSEKSISVFPNPVDGNEISLSFNFDPGIATTATIINNMGVAVAQVENIKTGVTTFIHHLDAGIYILNWKGTNETRVMRFSVK